MTISYRIDPDQGIVLTEASDVLTVRELMAHKQALLNDPQFRPGLKELSDVRQVDQLAVTPDDLRALAAFDHKHAAVLSEHKLALLVPNDYVFGMARMYQLLSESGGDNVMVFREEGEARRWLELPPQA